MDGWTDGRNVERRPSGYVRVEGRGGANMLGPAIGGSSMT